MASKAMANSGMVAARRMAAMGAAVGGGYIAYNHTRRGELYGWTKPFLDALDAEFVHRLGVAVGSQPWLVKLLGFADPRPDPPELGTTVWGLRFSNPVGLAAGYDKHAESLPGLAAMGFGFVEIGSVTPEPQDGNPKPRVFRLKEDNAVINRYGFNSQGVEAVGLRTEAWRAARDMGSPPGGHTTVLGINLGKNKLTEDAAADYEKGMARLGRDADYIVINVSSPNTPGLRALQGRKELEALLRRMITARNVLPVPRKMPGSLHGHEGGLPGGQRPLLLKIAPDLVDADLKDIAAVVLKLKVDGIIVSNTTIERPLSLKSALKGEVGGLSGQPVFDKSTEVLRRVYELTGGKVPLVGVGGVSNGKQAYAKIRAGASLVQLYTSFAFKGPAVVHAVKAELAELLRADGFTCVEDAVGADHRHGRTAKPRGK